LHSEEVSPESILHSEGSRLLLNLADKPCSASDLELELLKDERLQKQEELDNNDKFKMKFKFDCPLLIFPVILLKLM
jgi:hypothetical protein